MLGRLGGSSLEGGIAGSRPRRCAICGKAFLATMQHVYRSGSNTWYCSYTCYRAAGVGHKLRGAGYEKQREEKAQPRPPMTQREKLESRVRVCTARVNECSARLAGREWEQMTSRQRKNASDMAARWRGSLAKAAAELEAWKRENPAED